MRAVSQDHLLCCSSLVAEICSQTAGFEGTYKGGSFLQCQVKQLKQKKSVFSCRIYVLGHHYLDVRNFFCL